MYANRGKALELLIDYTNEVYQNMGYALVNKVPTPWVVNYNPKKRVNVAFPEKKGTVDYIGVSCGTALAFDAKSCQSKTSFPLKNVGIHQAEFLKQHQEQGGQSFLIVEFEKLNETYLITIDQFEDWLEKANEGGRKSIPYDYFKTNCRLIKSQNGIPLDYLGAIG